MTARGLPTPSVPQSPVAGPGGRRARAARVPLAAGRSRSGLVHSYHHDSQSAIAGCERPGHFGWRGSLGLERGARPRRARTHHGPDRAGDVGAAGAGGAGRARPRRDAARHRVALVAASRERVSPRTRSSTSWRLDYALLDLAHTPTAAIARRVDDSARSSTRAG